MKHWQRWARHALEGMEDPSWVPRPQDVDELDDIRTSLRAVEQSGDEPYYTLRAIVVLNGLERRGTPA